MSATRHTEPEPGLQAPSLERPEPDLLSVVVPAMNEEGSLPALYDALCRVLADARWELLIVDDGSTDGTFEVVRRLAAADSRVRGLSLSRNFGHQAALLAGLHHARGDVVISLDADLQHPPEKIPELVQRWREGFNVVRTRRIAEGELGWFKRKSSDWFYRLLDALSDTGIESGQSDFRLLDRQVVDVVKGLDEADLFLRGVIHKLGFRSSVVPYRVGARVADESKYGLGHMLVFALSGISCVSTLPLRIGIVAGFVTSGLAFLEILYVLWVSWTGNPVPGWASLAGLVALLFGINFILLGFIGIYLGHVFTRVQRHPAFVVERDTAQRSESDLEGAASGMQADG